MSQLEAAAARRSARAHQGLLIEHEMTSVFATHDQTEAMALADVSP
jgi:ABC-type sugar transport system ATPase subunit